MAAFAAAAANTAAILGVSLAPASPGDAVPRACIICGFQGTADLVLNLAFYLPLGAALALALRRPWHAVAAALLLSAGVEAAQLLVPGRDPTLGDLLANTLGAAAGAALARGGRRWMDPPPRAAAWLSLGAAAAALAVVAVTGAAATPSLPRAALRVEWAARTETLARYHGRVLAASLGSVPLLPSAVGDREIEPAPALDAPAVRRAFVAGGELYVRAVAGPAPASLAPLLGVYDGDRQSEVLLVGVEGEDLVLRVRTRAVPMRLRQPQIRVRGALRGMLPGDTVAMRARVVRGGFAVSVNDGKPVRAGMSPGGGWSLLLGPVRTGAAATAAAGAIWMAVLLLPLGLWVRSTAAGAAALALAAVGLAAVPAAAGLLPLTGWEAAGAAAGLAVGA
ncbi:MAG: VanZ family protein, partial [Longimicrobiaceae bacterium]